jgi:hypothetical protein
MNEHLQCHKWILLQRPIPRKTDLWPLISFLLPHRLPRRGQSLYVLNSFAIGQIDLLTPARLKLAHLP